MNKLSTLQNKSRHISNANLFTLMTLVADNIDTPENLSTHVQCPLVYTNTPNLTILRIERTIPSNTAQRHTVYICQHNHRLLSIIIDNNDSPNQTKYTNQSHSTLSYNFVPSSYTKLDMTIWKIEYLYDSYDIAAIWLTHNKWSHILGHVVNVNIKWWYYSSCRGVYITDSVHRLSWSAVPTLSTGGHCAFYLSTFLKTVNCDFILTFATDNIHRPLLYFKNLRMGNSRNPEKSELFIYGFCAYISFWFQWFIGPTLLLQKLGAVFENFH